MAAAIRVLTMRAQNLKLPKSHPHLAEITVDAGKLDELGFLLVDRAETKLLWVINDQPEVHQFYVGCASETVRDRLEARWN
ncbi:MAG: hypothetical protein Q8R97_02670 [Brevundimonas sp.]|nr:hypothetical protein [Brevundimonas sp.]